MTVPQETPPARGRRTVFGIMLAGFILVCLWWISYTPDNSHRLIYGIPANATYVTVHENLSARWTDIAANPAVRAALSAAGVSEEDMAEMALYLVGAPHVTGQAFNVDGGMAL